MRYDDEDATQKSAIFSIPFGRAIPGNLLRYSFAHVHKARSAPHALNLARNLLPLN